MGLPPSEYLPKNQKMGSRSKNEGQKRKIWVYKKRNSAWMGSGVIQMGSYFEKNNATSLRIIFKEDFWPPEAYKYKKKKKSSSMPKQPQEINSCVT